MSTEDPGEKRPENDADGWQPTGLELARAVAKSVAAAAGANTRRVGWRRGGKGRSFRTGSVPGKASGARPDDRDPQLLEATLDRLVFERGWTTDVAVAGAIARWDHIVGPEIAAHCKAERYAESELTVRTDSTAWAVQVKHLAPTLVKRLNEELGDGTVKKINVLGPTAPSWRKGPRSVRDGRGPRDTYG